MRRWIAHLRRLWALTAVVEWSCFYCGAPNDTPRLIWKELRCRLLCGQCNMMQNYVVHISKFDPSPPLHILEHREREREQFRAAL